MLFELLIKIWVTPENILGLIWNIITIVGMCLIFRAWNEKWWKSLIPFYGIYIMYRHAWKERKWLFVIQLLFEVVSAISAWIMRKHITSNVFHAIKTYIETEQLDIDISVPRLVICITLLLVSMLVTFVMTRITYLKICDSLNIKNTLLKIGTFFIPQIFLIVDYISYTKASQGRTAEAQKRI